jgi:glycosyltransferase involved in cell wall biosynthesis
LAGALAGLHEDPDTAARMGAAGKRRFQECFTREKMLDRLLEWYASLVPTIPGGTA